MSEQEKEVNDVYPELTFNDGHGELCGSLSSVTLINQAEDVRRLEGRGNAGEKDILGAVELFYSSGPVLGKAASFGAL